MHMYKMYHINLTNLAKDILNQVLTDYLFEKSVYFFFQIAILEYVF